MSNTRDLNPPDPAPANPPPAGLDSDEFLTGLRKDGDAPMIGPVKLTSRISRGGMGVVYRGRHVKLDIDVAVKFLLPNLATENPEYVVRFEREARIAAQLNNENLVRVYDVDSEKDYHYVVMELVCGETARDRVARKGRLSEAEAMEIVIGATRGLEAAHKKGIVHRDIKPENIMIDAAGIVKLADLGIAKIVSDSTGKGDANLTQPGYVMGTPSFMPPEQLCDSSTVGFAGDVYSMGATLYFLLTGKAPFTGSLFEIVQRAATQAFPDVRRLRPELSDSIVDILQTATARDARDRYRDATRLLQALESSGTSRLNLKDPNTGTVSAVARVSTPPARRVAGIRVEVPRERRGKQNKNAKSTSGQPGAAASTATSLASSPRGRRLVTGIFLFAALAATGLYLGIWLAKEWRGSGKGRDGDPVGAPSDRLVADGAGKPAVPPAPPPDRASGPEAPPEKPVEPSPPEAPPASAAAAQANPDAPGEGATPLASGGESSPSTPAPRPQSDPTPPATPRRPPSRRPKAELERLMQRVESLLAAPEGDTLSARGILASVQDDWGDLGPRAARARMKLVLRENVGREERALELADKLAKDPLEAGPQNGLELALEELYTSFLKLPGVDASPSTWERRLELLKRVRPPPPELKSATALALQARTTLIDGFLGFLARSADRRADEEDLPRARQALERAEKLVKDEKAEDRVASVPLLASSRTKLEALDKEVKAYDALRPYYIRDGLVLADIKDNDLQSRVTRFAAFLEQFPAKNRRTETAASFLARYRDELDRRAANVNKK